MFASFTDGLEAHKVVKKLLKYDADLTFTEFLEHHDALDLAALNNNVDIATAILEKIEEIASKLRLRSDVLNSKYRDRYLEYIPSRRLSLELLYHFVELNPDFAASFLLSPLMNLVPIADDDVDYRYGFPIRFGEKIVAGSQKPYFWNGRSFFGAMFEMIRFNKKDESRVIERKGVKKARDQSAAEQESELFLIEADIYESTISDWLARAVLRDGDDNLEVKVNRKASAKLARNLKKVRAAAFKVPVEDMASIEAITLLVKLADDSGRHDFFENPAIDVAVDFAWQTYGFRYHLIVTVFFVVYLAVVSITNYKFQEWSGDPTKSAASKCLVWLTIVMTLIYSVLEYREFIVNPAMYFRVLSNYFDVLAYALTICGSTMRLHFGYDTMASEAVLSFAIIFLTFDFLYYLRPYKETSAIVRMLYVERQSELFAFVFILGFVLYGFSQALYVLADGDSGNPFASEDTAYLYTFIYMMGGTDYSAFKYSKNPNVGITMIVLLVTVATIIFLNLLISVLGNSFNLIVHDAYLISRRHLQECEEECLQCDKIGEMPRNEQSISNSLPLNNKKCVLPLAP